MPRQTGSPCNANEFRCLNAWPRGTDGYAREQALIETLCGLCDEHGLLHVARLMSEIQDLWCHPEKRRDYEQLYAEQARMAKKAIAFLDSRMPSGPSDL